MRDGRTPGAAGDMLGRSFTNGLGKDNEEEQRRSWAGVELLSDDDLEAGVWYVVGEFHLWLLSSFVVAPNPLGWIWGIRSSDARDGGSVARTSGSSLRPLPAM